MRRRLLLSGLLGWLSCLCSACSVVPQRPYREHVRWPLTVPQTAEPPATSPSPGAKTLLVRDLSAAPGLEARGLQTLRPDGSLQIDPYEEWAVPPAAGATEALRERLAAAGLFAAVLAPGSRAEAGLILEGSLTALIIEPGPTNTRQARARLAILLIERHGGADRVRLQRIITATAPLTGDSAEAKVAALRRALDAALNRIVEALDKRIAVLFREKEPKSFYL